MVENNADTFALRVADLSQNTATRFEIQPETPLLSEIATQMGVLGLRKLRFIGEIRGHGKRNWALKGDLGFTVTQPCVVTLDPVNTRIDTKIERLFLANYDIPGEEEAEMPEDDNVEPLESHINPYTVMLEALALHLPQYPRKNGVELGESVHTAPGIAPMRDEDTRPFAGLASLRDQLKPD